MPHPIFVTTAQVAALLDLPPNSFLKRREELIRDHFFPEPMPTSRAPFRWRRDRVLAWIEEQGLPRNTPVTRPQGKNVYLLEEARRA
jgi:predicted DNA-binding transcriptional regulator AlpA